MQLLTALVRLNLDLCQSTSSILVKVFFATFSAFSQVSADWGVSHLLCFAKKLVKRQPCWKRVANSNFCDHLFE